MASYTDLPSTTGTAWLTSANSPHVTKRAIIDANSIVSGRMYVLAGVETLNMPKAARNRSIPQGLSDMQWSHIR